MSLSDWTKYFDGGTFFPNPQGLVYTDILTPLIGTGSVTFTHQPSIEFQSINVIPNILPTGYAAGRIRTLLRLDTITDTGGPNSQENHAGILCMQNQENLANFGAFGGVGQAYGMSVTVSEGLTVQKIRLWKFTAGLDGSTGSLNPSQILIEVTCPFVLIQGSTMCIELLWRTEPEVIADLGGAYLSVKVGQLSDFSDLTQVLSYIDVISPYTVTVTESLWVGFKNLTASPVNKITFDQTSIYRISIT